MNERATTVSRRQLLRTCAGFVVPSFFLRDPLPKIPSWTGERLPPEQEISTRISGAINKAFGEYQGQITLFNGRRLPWQTPFAEVGERSSSNWEQRVVWGGKGKGAKLHQLAQEVVGPKATFQFRQLVKQTERAVRQKTPAMIRFDLPTATCRFFSSPPFSSQTEFIQKYPGKEWQIYTWIDPSWPLEKTLWEQVVYPYLYCIGNRQIECSGGSIGVDCSGFVCQTLIKIAEAWGENLPQRLPIFRQPWRVGTWLYNPYNPRSRYTLPCSEKIKDLRPGEIILFKNSRRRISHSAIINEVLFNIPLKRIPLLFPQVNLDTLPTGLRGKVAVVSYCQSTDWVDQRGVNQQIVVFPMSAVKQGATLKDPQGWWSARRSPAFPGEYLDLVGPTQGQRLQTYGGVVVVLREIKEIVESSINSNYYPTLSN